MLGKLSSVAVVVKEVKAAGCLNWAVGELAQRGRESSGARRSGEKRKPMEGKTRRWIVAWSWWNLRPSLAVARGAKARTLIKGTARTASTSAAAVAHGDDGIEKKEERQQSSDNDDDDDADEGTKEIRDLTAVKSGDSAGIQLDRNLLPFPSEFDFDVMLQLPQNRSGIQNIQDRLNYEMKRLSGIEWRWTRSEVSRELESRAGNKLASGIGIAWGGDCWSRKARRRKRRMGDDTNGQACDNGGEQIKRREGHDGGQEHVVGVGTDTNTERRKQEGSNAIKTGETNDREPSLAFRITLEKKKSQQPEQPQAPTRTQDQQRILRPQPRRPFPTTSSPRLLHHQQQQSKQQQQQEEEGGAICPFTRVSASSPLPPPPQETKYSSSIEPKEEQRSKSSANVWETTDFNSDSDSKSTSTSVQVKIRWLQGSDHVLFESFCGWLRRRLLLHPFSP